MMIEHLLDKSLSPFDVCIVPIGGNKNPAVDVEAVESRTDWKTEVSRCYLMIVIWARARASQTWT